MYAVPSRVRRRRKRPILPSAAAAASSAMAEDREEEDGRKENGRGAAGGRFHPCDLCGCLPSKHVSKGVKEERYPLFRSVKWEGWLAGNT